MDIKKNSTNTNEVPSEQNANAVSLPEDNSKSTVLEGSVTKKRRIDNDDPLAGPPCLPPFNNVERKQKQATLNERTYGHQDSSSSLMGVEVADKNSFNIVDTVTNGNMTGTLKWTPAGVYQPSDAMVEQALSRIKEKHPGTLSDSLMNDLLELEISKMKRNLNASFGITNDNRNQSVASVPKRNSISNSTIDKSSDNNNTNMVKTEDVGIFDDVMKQLENKDNLFKPVQMSTRIAPIGDNNINHIKQEDNSEQKKNGGTKTTGLYDSIFSDLTSDADFYKTNSVVASGGTNNNDAFDYGAIPTGNKSTNACDQGSKKKSPPINFFLVWSLFGDRYCYFIIGTPTKTLDELDTSFPPKVMYRYLQDGRSKMMNETLKMSNNNLYHAVNPNTLEEIAIPRQTNGYEYEAKVYAFNFNLKGLMTIGRARKMMNDFLCHMRNDATMVTSTGNIVNIKKSKMKLAENFYQPKPIGTIIGINGVEDMFRYTFGNNYERTLGFFLEHANFYRGVFPPCTWKYHHLRYFGGPDAWLSPQELHKVADQFKNTAYNAIKTAATRERTIAQRLSTIWNNCLTNLLTDAPFEKPTTPKGYIDI